MTASERRRTWRATPLRGTLFWALALIGSCGDLARINPVDPNADLRLRIIGPDSADAVGDTLTFFLEAAAGVSLESADWSSTSELLTPLSAPGQYRVGAPVLGLTAAMLTVRIGAHEVSKPFRLKQHIAGVAVTDCNGGRTVRFKSLMDATQPTSFGFGICANYVDRRGFPIANIGVPGLTLTVRDAAVARIVTSDPLSVNAVGNGTTYIVGTSGTYRDSIQITVRQVPRFIDADPPGCLPPGVTLNVGETLQVTASPRMFDENSNLVTDPATIQASINAMRWTPYWDAYNVFTVSPEGLVTALAPGQSIIYGNTGLPETTGDQSFCFINVR